MKVVVVGGYGVFGSRLAELLVRDGHDVVIAGRSLDRAARLAARLRCTALAVDVRADPRPVFAVSPQVVVDAAGPFQAYGADPYCVPRLCVEYGVDYLDLSDDAAFTRGLAVLDAEARAAGRRLLSGVSSVPGISSAIAADLARDFAEVLLIDTAILPGNRAPRGASVIASIVGQLGTTSRAWRGGRWREQRCWTDPRRIRLGPDLVRTARCIEVPDVQLFPAFFRARSVVFRAGLEVAILSAGMRLLGAMRRRWTMEVTPRRADLLRRFANLLLPFGTDRGGMRVAVVGRTRDGVIEREWRLLAEGGHGPYIPAVAARALIRRLDSVPPGARACLAEITRAELEQAMVELSVRTSVEERARPALFEAALADRWRELPRELQALHEVHDVESFSGMAAVTRGHSPVARLAAWLFGFPPATDAVPLTVTMRRTDGGETWERNFGGRVLRSQLASAPVAGRVRERFGPFTYELALDVVRDGLQLPVRRGWFLGIPLPRWLLPGSDSREYVQDGVFHFDVGLSAPLHGGLVVRYRGSLRSDAGSSTASAEARDAQGAYPAG